MPDAIVATVPKGKHWVIYGEGDAKYVLKLENDPRIVPNSNLAVIRVPDSTPEIIKMFDLKDEQALLARLRYNRLIDVFLGLTTYSLQSHLRTKIKSIGQIEIDEMYVGINKKGEHFVIPVQAKGGTDSLSTVQTWQDIECCKVKFPDKVCRAVSAQFMDGEKIALFELGEDAGEIKIIEEKHYLLVPSGKV